MGPEGSGILADMTIVLLQKMNTLWEAQIKRFHRDFEEVKITADRSRIPEAEVLIGTRMTPEELQSASRLQAMIVPMAGVDTLPLDIIRQRGIRLTNVHGNAEAVAERTAALILAWFGKIISYHQDLQKHIWHAFWIGKGVEDTWESISGKRCSILGAGSIGSETARRLKPFGVEIIGYKRTRADVVPPEYDRMVYDIDEAIEAGEIIISVLPATPETRGIITPRRLSAMSGKVFVNVGRADVAEEGHLYEALADGTLRGAALDCWYSYPSGPDDQGPPSRFPFQDLPNVVLSPHIAGFTRDSVARSISEAFDHLRRYITRGEFLHEVEADRGY